MRSVSQRLCGAIVLRVSAAAGILGLATAILAGGASATPDLYYSPLDDGVPAPVASLPVGQHTLPLYIFAGAVASTSGSACATGDGDEICGWQFEAQGTGGLSIASFAAEADVVANLDGGTLLANAVQISSPGSLIPLRIGVVTVDVAGPGELRLESGLGIGAALEKHVLATEVLALPEPSAILGYGCGLASLSLLQRVRSRSALNL